MGIQIITDSACDFTKEDIKELGIDVIPIKTIFGETEYKDGVDLTQKEFFEKLIESDVFPKTSQICPYEYEEKFKEYTDRGDKVICITISSKLSGCYQNAVLASESFEGIYVIDSLNVTVGERILVEYAVEQIRKGATVDELVKDLNTRKKQIRLIALLDTLEYLKKGGRISAAAAMAGSLLSIKPVIAIQDGAVAVLGKARGSKAGNNMLREMIEREGKIDFDMPFALAYSGLSESVLDKYLADHKDLYDTVQKELTIRAIGSAIGTHIGPGAIAFAWFIE